MSRVKVTERDLYIISRWLNTTFRRKCQADTLLTARLLVRRPTVAMSPSFFESAICNCDILAQLCYVPALP
jgi:hypothetical protein